MWALLLPGKSQASCMISPLPFLHLQYGGKGNLISSLPSLTRMSLSGRLCQPPGDLEKAGAMPSPPWQILMLFTSCGPDGQHGTELTRNLRVGWIQQQRCYIFLLVRTVSLKGMQTSLFSLRVPNLPGLHGATRFLGSRTFSTKTRIVLGTPRRLLTLLVEITEQNALASVTKPQFIWGAML